MKPELHPNIPARRLAAATSIKMKSILTTLIVTWCALWGTSNVFGQTTYIWTAGGDGTNLADSANWNPNGLPSGASQDTAEWDGVTSTNLLITDASPGLPSTGYGSQGINFYLTANQTNPVQIISQVSKSPAIGVNFITLDSGAASLTLGDTTANNLLLFGRPAGGTHTFMNNSTNPATIDQSVEWQAGGGQGYTYDFSGSGDWIVNNYLMPDNGAWSPMLILVEGPGTVFWSAGKTGNYKPNSGLGTVTIAGGTLVIKSSGLFTGSANQSIVDSGIFEYDAPSQSQTLTGPISGTGAVQVNSGTLTLSGQSTYNGTNLLTGGELIAGGPEDPGGTFGPLGVGSTISFAGGTLGFSINNVFDYSPRFSTNANQAYSIDTAGQNVTFTNETGLISSGGTLAKLGAGTLTLTGTNTYTGNTTVAAGKLVFVGPMTGAGNITVADSAALGITANGTELMPSTLTLGTSGGATLEFNELSSMTTAPLAPGTIATAGTVTININSGTFTPGHSYPLIAWNTGSAPAVSLGILNGYIGALSTNGNTIQVNISGTAFTWTGGSNGNWDTTTTGNWMQNGAPAVFANGGPALFDDSASLFNVTVNSSVLPTTITIDNETNAYSITSSGANNIGGSANLTKSGSGTLALSGGANTYTGTTTVGGGTLAVGVLANGGSASDIGSAGSSSANWVLNGGTLQYTGGGADVDRLFTLGTGGGTIESSGSGALVLNGTGALGYLGNGPRGLTLTGGEADTNTLAANIADNGGATTLTKNGTGTWVLTGTNTYSGGTTIASGLLQVGAGGPSGALGSGNVVNNGAIDFNLTGTLTVNGAISGTGSVTNDGSGTVILAGNNSYNGGTTINAGTLQLGNGGGTGSLAGGVPIVDNGLLIFDSSGTFSYNGAISGTGNVIAKRGYTKAIGANSYSGWTEIDSGATFVPTENNQGAIVSSVVTNNGTLRFMCYDTRQPYYGNVVGSGKVQMGANNATYDAGEIVLAGTNTYTGGTYIGGNHLIFGDGITPQAGSFVGNVYFVNNFETSDDTIRRLIFNRPDDFTYGGNIVTNFTSPQSNLGIVNQNGSGTLTLTGTNTYAGGTVINAGAIQVGNGGTSGTIGYGGVTDSGTLIFNHSDNMAFAGNIADGTTGPGSVVQTGSGTLTLSSPNLTYTGATTVSNGTLVVSGGNLAGELDVDGGTFAPAAAGAVGNVNVAGAMNLNSGTVLVTVNTGLSPSNSTFTVTGGVNYAGGTLELVNAGSSLAVGDQFTLFNQAVSGGAAVRILSPGFTVINNLAVDGSVTVSSVISARQTITASVSAGQMTLSWPNAGVHLEVQTNSLAVGLSTNWFSIPGTTASNSYTVPLNSTNGCVFYRLAQ